MLLSKFLEDFFEVPPTGLVLSEEQVGRNLLKAVRFYNGFADFENGEINELKDNYTDGFEIDGENDADLTNSEFAIIRPLFDLYVELENSTALEASRTQGVEVWGRQTSEIQGEISQYEASMNKLAFKESFFTI